MISIGVGAFWLRLQGQNRNAEQDLLMSHRCAPLIDAGRLPGNDMCELALMIKAASRTQRSKWQPRRHADVRS